MNRKRAGGNGKAVLISLIIALVFAAGSFYITLPALNVRTWDFWSYLLSILIVYILSFLLLTGSRLVNTDISVLFFDLKQKCKLPLIILLAILAIGLIGNVISAPIFHAKAYYNLLDVQTGDFSSDVAEISYSEIPMLDKDSTVQLGRRALGNISTNSNLVSQFEVSAEYSQINYQGQPVRVAPLEYGNLVKWFNNRSAGLPGYIVVNMVTQEAKLVQLEQGMTVSTSEHFGRNLYRLIRFRYPTMMFGDVNFEIDEDGTPWWICSRVVKTIGLFGGEDIHGAVLVNAVTGESQYYEEVPSWVDRVYNADLVVSQYNYHGAYVNGWINSWLGQKGVTTTTSGYNYIALNDDVYLYTGVTSAGSDESNVGFILVNQRTKDARYYNITGAEEYSAMSSAEGAVQHLNYTATFPILLNIADQPTYFMALKDSAQLVKMYAMVNVSDYQITATGSSVAECQKTYEALLTSNGISVDEPVDETDTLEVTLVLSDIRSAVVDGNTRFYLSEDNQTYYVISASDCAEAVILNIGDKVKITYTDGESALIPALNVELVK